MQILKLNDGAPSRNPHLSDMVRDLQGKLNEVRLAVEVTGYFGCETEDAVMEFQFTRGLTVDGIVGDNTWAALNARREPHGIKGFRGDLSWVHAQEGHNGSAYWPKGKSGVTLDPGIDCGYASSELIEQLYISILSNEQFVALREVYGLKGETARRALEVDPILKTIKVSKEQAGLLFPRAAEPYWENIVPRFPSLLRLDTLPAVHTAMLSLSYNRGANNKELDVLEGPLEAGDWAEVATRIASMQQDHELVGIRKRRRAEAELIRDALD